MSVIPEETLFTLLNRCLHLSQQALQQMSGTQATEPISQEVLDEYSAFVQDLHREKRHDTVLADQTWEWIWEVKPNMNPIQLYGRMAWINYNLIDLL